MPDLSSMTVTVIDNGLFCDFALTIAPKFKELFYWTPWASSFPKSNSLLPGDGHKGMKRVRWAWDAIRRSDLIVFPDVYFGDMQQVCVEMGKQVWGARRGESLELNRMGAKALMRSLGITPSEAKAVIGLEELRKLLKSISSPVYVKVSTVRGDFETFRVDNYELAEPKLDELEHKLGAKKLIEEFVVEPSIEDAVEWGIDAYTVDGKWPKRTFSGLEIKDLGFLGRVMEWEEIPEYLREPNEKLSPWFKQKEYRGFFSTELRITEDKKTYLIDPCCRLPSPPNEIQQMIFSNWAEIIESGSRGEMIDPEKAAQYGVCAMIHSAWADANWQAIRFPDEIRPFVKLRNHTIIEGVDYCVPQQVGLPEVGAVIGLGDTLDEAIDNLKENAEQIEGYYVEIKTDSIDKALEEREKAEKLGLSI